MNVSGRISLVDLARAFNSAPLCCYFTTRRKEFC